MNRRGRNGSGEVVATQPGSERAPSVVRSNANDALQNVQAV